MEFERVILPSQTQHTMMTLELPSLESLFENPQAAFALENVHAIYKYIVLSFQIQHFVD
jgi:hypothetical protein